MAETWTTRDAIEKHIKNCSGIAKCKHRTKQRNENGDCYDCDGEGEMMCPCQGDDFNHLFT
jgi:hypothetical protein